MLSDQILQEFMMRFYGYGNYHAKYWFVGTEEGIRKSKDPRKLEKKIRKKLGKWHDRGGQSLEDLRSFQLALDRDNDRFAEHAKLDVATWRAIIHVLLGIEGREPKKSEVRKYQSHRLARKNDAGSCLLELLPLPAANVRTFPAYHKISKIQCLTSRRAYVEQVMPERVLHLKSKIAQYRPKVVVLYGKTYRDYQKEVAGVEFSRRNGVKVGRNKDTLFLLIKHPNAKGVTNAYFDRIGKMIRRELKLP
jgi:hypothetical protein